jgi:hypothetical protein
MTRSENTDTGAPAPLTAALERVGQLFLSSGTRAGILPPTALYNEGWMLRLVLDWFARQEPMGHPFDVMPRHGWRSEVLLPSAFLARRRGDELAESFTHADAIIGVTRAGSGRGDVLPAHETKQFVVVEAKLMSGLSAGTKRAATYNQAARNVACLATALAQGELKPHDITAGFVVVAPASQIDAGIFNDWCKKERIIEVVRARVAAYKGDRDEWLQCTFLPAVSAIDVQLLSWESVLEHVRLRDAENAAALTEFYERCLLFNARRELATDTTKIRSATAGSPYDLAPIPSRKGGRRVLGGQ